MKPLSARTNTQDYRQAQPFVAGDGKLGTNPYFQKFDVASDPRNVIRGTDNLSGSTLRGQAARYSGHYARSRTALIHKLAAAGVCGYCDSVLTTGAYDWVLTRIDQAEGYSA